MISTFQFGVFAYLLAVLIGAAAVGCVFLILYCLRRSQLPKADRFWWLPILLALSSPWWWIGLGIAIQRPREPSFDAQGWPYQGFCPAVLFALSIPGFLSLFSIVTVPAIVILLKRLNGKNDPLLFLAIAYLCMAVTGFGGTVSRFTSPSQNSTAPAILYIIAAIAPCIALLVLIMGWLKKKILLRTLLAATLSPLFMFALVYYVYSAGGSEAACVPGHIITTP